MRLTDCIICFIISFLFCFQTVNGQNDNSKLIKLLDSAYYYGNSNTQKAENYYLKALQEATLNTDSIQTARILSQLGILSEIKSDYSKAVDFHLKSLSINNKLKDSFNIAVNYHNIAMIMRFQKDYELSKSYFEKAIEIRKTFDNPIYLGISYNMLGIIYRMEGDYDTALQYYQKAFKIFNSKNNIENLIIVYGNLATLYDFRKEYKKSIDINLKAIPYYKELNNKVALSTRYTNIARSYENLAMHKTAIKYLDSAIAIEKEQGFLEDLAANYLYRSNNYYKLKRYKEAVHDYQDYKFVNDSVFNDKKTKEITTRFLQLDFEKQKALDSIQFSATQKRLEFINETEKNKKNTYFILLIGSLLMGAITLSNYRNKRILSKTKLEKEQLESELLKQKLEATEREAQRVVNGKSISLTHKKNLLSQIKHLVKKHDSSSIFKDLNLLTFELEQQAKTETLDYVLDDNLKKLHVEFEKKLINTYPELTKTEREICSLIRAKMSIKDVANIKGVSSASVQSARYRIRKKMNLQKGEELHQFIQNLF